MNQCKGARFLSCSACKWGRLGIHGYTWYTLQGGNRLVSRKVTNLPFTRFYGNGKSEHIIFERRPWKVINPCLIWRGRVVAPIKRWESFLAKSVWPPEAIWRSGKVDVNHFSSFDRPSSPSIPCLNEPQFKITNSSKWMNQYLSPKISAKNKLIEKYVSKWESSPKKKRMKTKKTSWWFQPIWKILVKLDHFPR